MMTLQSTDSQFPSTAFGWAGHAVGTQMKLMNLVAESALQAPVDQLHAIQAASALQMRILGVAGASVRKPAQQAAATKAAPKKPVSDVSPVRQNVKKAALAVKPTAAPKPVAKAKPAAIAKPVAKAKPAVKTTANPKPATKSKSAATKPATAVASAAGTAPAQTTATPAAAKAAAPAKPVATAPAKAPVTPAAAAKPATTASARPATRRPRTPSNPPAMPGTSDKTRK